MQERDGYGLSAVDRRIITELMRGQTFDDIARALRWGSRTLSVRVKVLYRKLGVANRAELERWAQEHL